MKKPVIPILLFYIVGILYGRYLPLYLTHLTVFIIFILIISLSFAVIARRSRSNLNILISAFSVLTGAVAINYQSLTLPDNHISNLINNEKTSIEGVLYKPPEILENKTRLYIDVEKISDRVTAGKVKITLYRDNTEADYKDKVRIKDVRLHIPRNFKNPGGFDYKRYMEDVGIYVIGSISKGNQIEILDKYEGGILSYIYKSKEGMSIFLEKNAAHEESSLLKTMVFGERSAVTREMRNIFSSTGIAHLLAVSGLHVGFVAFASFLVLKKIFSLLFLNFNRRLFLIGAVQRVASFFTIFPVLYYSILVGGSPSAVRAAIMSVVYLLSLVMYRENDIYNTLSLAALIILIWHPPSLFNIGFQLSFIAVISIVYGFSVPNPLNLIQGQDASRPSSIVHRPDSFFSRHRWLYNYIFSSIFATLGTLPLIAYHFNLVSIIGPVVNIMAIPLASIIVPLTLIFSILSNISEQSASLLINIPIFLTYILVKTARLFTNIPYYSIRVQTPSLLTIFMIYPLLLGVLNIKRHRLIKIGTISICLLFIISILTHHSSLITRHSLRVSFLDVGQAECSLIQFPNGKTMLIDGGRLMDDFDAGSSIVAPYLWDIGITKIDYVIGSHPDSDHVGGLLFILNEMPVRNYFDNGQESADLIHEKLREIAREKNIPYGALYAGDEIKVDEKVKVEILHPPSNKNLEFGIRNLELLKSGHDNNSSIVMKISYGSFSVLFTGDIEKEAEGFLINQTENVILSEAKNLQNGNRPQSLKSTILKTPHHGSSSSSTEEFIKEVNPEVAVFSVGYNNPFRHPNKKVLTRYSNAGVKIYRTDRDGMIQIESDGNGYIIKTYEQLVN